MGKNIIEHCFFYFIVQEKFIEFVIPLPLLSNELFARLYYDLDPGDPLMADLCSLACSHPNLDLCYVRDLPGNPVRDASSIFGLIQWKQNKPEPLKQ